MECSIYCHRYLGWRPSLVGLEAIATWVSFLFGSWKSVATPQAVAAPSPTSPASAASGSVSKPEAGAGGEDQEMKDETSKLLAMASILVSKERKKERKTLKDSARL